MKFALIGCGARGHAYAAAAAGLGLDIALCADPSAAAAKKAAALCRARGTTNCDRCLVHKDIHAVLVCVPPRSLPGHLRRAAKSRKPVLIAPPLDPKTEATRKAIEAARAAGIHVYIAHDTRVAPEYAAIAAQLDPGAIGRPGFIRIVRAGAAPGAKSGASALMFLLAPDLDWLAGRFGAGPRLFAQTAHGPGVDHASVTLTFPEGPIVQWVGTCCARGESPRTSIEICGDAGLIQFTTGDLVIESSSGAGKRPQSALRSSPISPSIAARHLSRFAALMGSDPAQEAYDRELTVLRMLDAVTQSDRTGREIRL